MDSNLCKQSKPFVAAAIASALSVSVALAQSQGSSEDARMAAAARESAATSSKANEALKAMTAYYNSGRYEEAQRAGAGVLSADPSNLMAHYMMGNIFAKTDSLDSATAEYEYCFKHGLGTRIGEYARAALDKLNKGQARPVAARGAASQPAGGTQAVPSQYASGPPRIEMEANERQATALKTAQISIDNKRRTMEAQLVHLNDTARDDIAAVPKYFYDSRGHRSSNPNYAAQVQEIKDKLAADLNITRVDFENESEKINSFYNKMAQGYARQPENVRSQGEDNRDHRVIDDDPSMFVHNFGKQNLSAGGGFDSSKIKQDNKAPATTSDAVDTVKGQIINPLPAQH